MANRNVVVIGGSTGATGPLGEILSRLPVDLPAAVFIVLHMPAQGAGILKSVARAAGKLPVRQAQNGMRFENGHVYLAVPDHHLMLVDGHMILGRGPRENLARPAIDPLFRSAALNYGPRAIGIVLSGLLSDGSAGLSAIKRCAGLALVQDPAEANADEMPIRATKSTTVDFCVPAAQIGKLLPDLVRAPPGLSVSIPADLLLEVQIAAGEGIGAELIREIADATELTCPDCGGVLSKLKLVSPLRFRCQVGHAYNADVLAEQQESRVDEALRVGLRIIEERAELLQRLAEEAHNSGWTDEANTHKARSREYREHADSVRRALLKSIEPSGREADD
ncbi:chemotaxis protein CheB [Bradyrhizobium sp. UFLA05-112]